MLCSSLIGCDCCCSCSSSPLHSWLEISCEKTPLSTVVLISILAFSESADAPFVLALTLDIFALYVRSYFHNVHTTVILVRADLIHTVALRTRFVVVVDCRHFRTGHTISSRSDQSGETLGLNWRKCQMLFCSLAKGALCVGDVAQRTRKNTARLVCTLSYVERIILTRQPSPSVDFKSKASTLT